MVLTGTHENENKLKPSLTLFISKSWAWKKNCLLKRKTDIGFSLDSLMTSSLEIVMLNESSVCVVVGTNWFRM